MNCKHKQKSETLEFRKWKESGLKNPIQKTMKISKKKKYLIIMIKQQLIGNKIMMIQKLNIMRCYRIKKKSIIIIKFNGFTIIYNFNSTL